VRLPPPVVPALGLIVVFAAGLAAIPQQPSFRSGVDVVNLGVAVIDKAGAAVGGLTQDDFVVYEEGKKQDGEREPLPPYPPPVYPLRSKGGGS